MPEPEHAATGDGTVAGRGTQSVDPAGVLELLWGQSRSPKRGPKPALTLERITREAIGIADAEGLPAVSMQRVAEELGFTKMSLYRYVPGKAELIALMIDAALPPPEIDEADGWCARFRAWGLQLWNGLERHPWVLEVTTGRRPIGPNELAWLETGVAALSGVGLRGGEMLDAVVLMNGHIRSLAQQTIAAPVSRRIHSERDATDMMAMALREHGERYPAILAAMEPSAEATPDNALEFGIERILDGLETFVERRRHERAER
ncbi:TetR/AcrR family transcriptional regulator [Phytoactinopolyspora mesophila]|uniref:TetR family transcriptional regulator n=1 Tax=Phytoactinopolyspora mesophila TaxID=2650750 RepID=A0A7K3M300_9ACTN|nr:TetR/AcrR family transcriptional regulator [Phytoactinopolyspora mesophila]NDL56818.1 TetR family transcriptional regulator [Phytoactinopolyspora mesophila]